MTTPAEARESNARTAGRGGVAVLGAKAFFIVIGLAQQTLLPHAIGLAGYGAFSRVMAIANVLNNVVVASSIQGVSRAVASARGHEAAALRTALRVHVPLAVLLAATFALLAPAMAAFQGAPHIRAPLAAVAAVTLLYGIYAPLVGSLNGRAVFTRQAGLDVTSAILRTVLLIGVGALFVSRGLSGALGATVGAGLAALAILPLAFRWARGTSLAGGRSATSAASSFTADDTPALTERVYLAHLLPLAGAQLFTNALMQIDITLLGRFLSQGALASGLTGDGAARAADEWVAVYRACQLFAFLPYQLLMSITQVLFPMLARARAERDDDAVRAYVLRGARLAAIACGLFVGVVAAIPESLLALAFGPLVAARGASALRVLAIGQGAFTLFGVASTVLTSLGRERIAALVSLGAVALVASACTLLVPDATFGGAQLIACASATSAALGIALVTAALLVRGVTGAFVPAATTVRVAVAVGAVVSMGLAAPRFGKLATPLVAAGVGAVYVAILLVTREIGRDDMTALRSIVGRKRA